jgi:hypothetical protein
LALTAQILLLLKRFQPTVEARVERAELPVLEMVEARMERADLPDLDLAVVNEKSP